MYCEAKDLNELALWSVRSVSQSKLFMCELIPTIYRLLKDKPHATVLDIGACTGAGSNLLRELFHPDVYTTVKLDVTALDISDQYKYFAGVMFPNLPYIVGNVEDIPSESYDFVMASHVLEHVYDPVTFLDHLRRISRGNVLVVCPFDERDLIPEHLNCIDQEFVNKVNPLETVIYDSIGWVKSKCILMTF